MFWTIRNNCNEWGKISLKNQFPEKRSKIHNFYFYFEFEKFNNCKFYCVFNFLENWPAFIFIGGGTQLPHLTLWLFRHCNGNEWIFNLNLMTNSRPLSRITFETQEYFSCQSQYFQSLFYRQQCRNSKKNCLFVLLFSSCYKFTVNKWEKTAFLKNAMLLRFWKQLFSIGFTLKLIDFDENKVKIFMV